MFFVVAFKRLSKTFILKIFVFQRLPLKPGQEALAFTTLVIAYQLADCYQKFGYYRGITFSTFKRRAPSWDQKQGNFFRIFFFLYLKAFLKRNQLFKNNVFLIVLDYVDLLFSISRLENLVLEIIFSSAIILSSNSVCNYVVDFCLKPVINCKKEGIWAFLCALAGQPSFACKEKIFAPKRKRIEALYY